MGKLTKELTQSEIKKFIKELEKFNYNAEELKRSNFIKWFRKNKLEYEIIFREKKGRKYRYPTKDSIKAFILTYRFFIQDKDECSFRVLQVAYDRLPVDGQKSLCFNKYRKFLNNFLDAKSTLQVSGLGLLTNREIQDIFLYGELSHQDDTKLEKYKKWTESEFIRHHFWIEFCFIIETIFNLIMFTWDLNDKVIREMDNI